MSGSAFAVTHHAFSSGAGRTSDGNGSHASTLKLPSYTKSVSWQHYLVWLDAASIESFGVYKSDLNRFMVKASTITGKEYRASIYSIPEMLIEDALHDLISQCSDL